MRRDIDLDGPQQNGAPHLLQFAPNKWEPILVLFRKACEQVLVAIGSLNGETNESNEKDIHSLWNVQQNRSNKISV